jgi:glycosyltransferase involved in cell wall biosynthesis
VTSPDVSVVVPTRNRPQGLSTLITALAGQDLARERFEVIVVDDGSDVTGTPPPEGELAPGLSLRLLRHGAPRGPAAARNTGWRAAAGRLIAFTDDDCRPAPRWLCALLDAWGGAPELIVQGRTEPAPEGRFALDPLCLTQIVRGPSGYFETCNIAYSRALLERVGGFDEWFRRPCGEDLDLGRRAVKSGARLQFAGNALIYHAVTRPPLSHLVRRTTMWTDAVQVLRRHPELRAQLPGRVFWKWTHPWLIAALAAGVAGAAARRPTLAIAGWQPYLAHYRRLYAGRPWPWGAVARRMPAHLAVDLTEIATMIAGSVRHRTLML